MSRRRKYAPIERLRLGLLVVLLLLSAGMVTIYLQREEPAPTPRIERGQLLDAEGGEDIVLAGQGFEYEHTEGDRRVFRIEAEQIVTSRQGRIQLRRVRIDVEREQGEPYVVICDRAVYHVATSEATLEGNVRVESRNGMDLRTEGLELVRSGTALSSTAPVQFELGDGYRGRADELLYHFNSNRLRLHGDVRITSQPVEIGVGERGSLRSTELVIERDERLVRAEGRVELRRGESVLKARRLTLTFGPDERTLQFARAFWNVDGKLRRDTGNDFGTTAEFSGYELSLELEGDRFKRAELESAKGQRASLKALDDSGLRRSLDAPYLLAEFTGGELSLVRAYDGVVITESLPFARDQQLRQVCSQWALASFDELGELDSMVLQNEVDYHQPGLQGEGQRVESRPGELAFTGKPAVLRTDRGIFQAPRIVRREASGEVEAVDGVRAEFPASGRFSLIGEGDATLPIRLTAREAGWDDAAREYRFEGEVRAWQGENYLLANRVGGELAGNRLVATGRVKTVMTSRPEETGEARPQPAEEAPASGTPDRRTIEVTSESLTYERPERKLAYAGSVKAHESGRTMRCSEMDAWMTDQDKFERLVCRGEMVLENPDGGHTVRGDEAVYEPENGKVEISGTPAVMTGRDGAELRGPVVIYDMLSGAAQVRSLPRKPERPSP